MEPRISRSLGELVGGDRRVVDDSGEARIVGAGLAEFVPEYADTEIAQHPLGQHRQGDLTAVGDHDADHRGADEERGRTPGRRPIGHRDRSMDQCRGEDRTRAELGCRQDR